jgi:hypothetical protein
MLRHIWIPLCLLTFVSCSTSEPKPDLAPKVVVQDRIVREKVPETLTRPCPKKRRTPPISNTQSIVDRLNYTEGALDKCSAQVSAIRKWSEGEPK